MDDVRSTTTFCERTPAMPSTTSHLARLWILSTMIAAAAGCANLAGTDERLVARWENPTGVAPGILAGEGEPAVVMAAEASPDRKRQTRAEFMNSSQVAAYLRRGGRLAILPLGSVEPHGPHAPLGTTAFINYATGVLLAEQWNAIVFPPIAYTAAPRSDGLLGTVSVSYDETVEYVTAVIDSLLDHGFTQVVLLAGEDRYAMAESLVNGLHRRRQAVVQAARPNLLPNTEEVTRELGYEAADDIRVLAALQILGHPGAFDPASPAAATSPSALAGAREKLGAAGLRAAAAYGSVADSLPVRTCVRPGDADKAIGIMRRLARRAAPLPQLYDQYMQEINGQWSAAPWSIGNYRDTIARCRQDAVAASYPPVPPVTTEEKRAGDVRIAASALPIEASPERLRKYRAEFMSAAALAEYRRQGDTAILPVGAFEMHGPHAMLNTDTFEAHAGAVLAAEQWNAVVFPSICYTYGGATEPWPGSVSVSPDVIARYVQAVAESLLESGFRRVIINWVHAPGGPGMERVASNLWRERRQVVFGTSLHPLRRDAIQNAVGYSGGEDCWSLASATLLGHPGVFVVDEPQDAGTIKLSYHSLVDMRELAGCRPMWYMGYPTQHLAVRSCVKAADVPKLLDVMRESAKAWSAMPAAMDTYLREAEAFSRTKP
jgi:creatinine amidohydrolase/Fe(II)-dependent formamide hydrolase-like protein